MATKPVFGIDLDGTILDCRPRQTKVLLDLCPEVWPLADAIWLAKRSGMSTLAALRAHHIEPPEDFEALWLNWIEDPAVLTLDLVLPGGKDALQTLRRYADLVLISARQNPRGVYDTLDRCNLSQMFKAVQVVGPGATAADAKAVCLQKAGAVAHCGDSEVDGRCAALVGVPFWAVTCGQRSGVFLRETCAIDSIHPSLEVLVANLGFSPEM